MRSRLALGTLFAATTASLTLTVTGLAGFTADPRGVGGFFTPSASAAELVPFDDCEELLRWYVDEAVSDVGPYGLDDFPVYAQDMGVTGMRTNLGGELASVPVIDAVESSGTGTNVQQVGVDEPDRAKTDGTVVVHVRGRELVVTDVAGSEPREIGTLDLPRDLSDAELLLSGDTVLVIAPERGGWGPWGEPIATDIVVSRMMPYPAPTADRSRVLEVSIADPGRPVLVYDQTFGGTLLSARQYGGTVRLAFSTTGPVLDFVQPNRERTPKEATAENRRILQDSGIDDWLPTVAVDGGPSVPLVACEDVRHPGTAAGYGTVSVVTFGFSDPTDRNSLAVTTDGQTVYSSADRLYLTTWGGRNTTEVHAFSLDGATTSYVASGKVQGTLKDRWSLDEHDGVLRLALAHGPGWSPEENGITTLREDGRSLEVVGSVRGLGPDEEIKSVRWFDDLAIVVTFRQTDPLYTVDLSDPADPRTLGELKIPGFSEYLHPIGGGRLLGLGQDATMQGRVVGGQVSLFDVGDLTDPRRLDTLALGRHAYPAAAYDPRTFTWFADRGTGLAVVESHWDGASSLIEMRVSSEGGLVEGDSWPLGRWDAGQARALPLPDGTVALVSTSVDLVELD